MRRILDASLIAATLRDLIGPKGEASRVRLAIQKIEIVLSYEENCVGVVERIAADRSVVIGNRH